MDIKNLSADFSVSPQISPTELKEVAAQGFKSIIKSSCKEEFYFKLD